MTIEEARTIGERAAGLMEYNRMIDGWPSDYDYHLADTELQAFKVVLEYMSEHDPQELMRIAGLK